MILEISRSQSGRDGNITFSLMCQLTLTTDDQAALTRYGHALGLADSDVALFAELTSADGFSLAHRSFDFVASHEHKARALCALLIERLRVFQSWEGSDSVEY